MRKSILAGLGFGVMTMFGGQAATAQSLPERRAVRFVGGFEMDPRDGGRPVGLIASALGVPSDVFREAFSHVRPARGGQPDPAQVQQNKQALLAVLGRFQVTNERLDEVSDYYRYMRSRGETWRHAPATAYAIVLGGVVQSITLTSAGASYSSAPTVVVEGTGVVRSEVSIAFTRAFATNGSIRSIKILSGTAKR